MNKSLHFLVCIGFALFFGRAAAQDCESDEEETTEKWITNGGFIIFFLFVAMSFWGLAVVCEDYFVPALNLLCDDLKLDNDVAGATIMAAGNSSPELFACMISLFVTKTALGAGTAIGSAIFNHLCICSGSVLYSKGGELQINWRILSRECSFYGASLFILVWALKGNLSAAFKHAFDHVGGTPESGCLSVHWYQAFVLLLGYISYAVVCSNYRLVVSVLCPIKETNKMPQKVVDEARHVADMHVERIGVDENGFAQPVETYEAPIPSQPGLSFANKQSLSLMEGAYPASLSVLPGQMHHSRMSSVDGGEGVKLVPLSRGNSLVDGNDQSPVAEEEEGVGNPMQQDLEQGQQKEVNSEVRTKMRNGSIAEEGENDDDVERISRLSENADPMSPEAAMKLAEVAARLTSGGGGVDEENGSRVSYSPMDVPQNATFECWMYKRSRFYSRIRVLTSQKWQLRYFKLDPNGLWYCRHKTAPDGKLHVKAISIFDAISVKATDLDLFEFEIVTRKRKYVFRCSNENDFMGMFSVLAKDISVFRTYDDEKRVALAAEGRAAMLKLAGVDIDHEEEGGGHDLMAAPTGGMALLVHYLLLPLKAMIYYSIPQISTEQEGDFDDSKSVSGDKEEDKNKESKPPYQTTIWMCVLWLAILSYVMNFCLEELGKFFGISSGTMGLTFGAAGTSFPNLLSSMIVAKQGLGDMAVSNAFGSNIFCIFFGLGFPWLLYIILNNGEPYKGLKDDGIVFAVVILLIVLFSFLVLLGVYQFRMKYWMGTVFLVLYGFYLLFAIFIG
jgi:Ca2+/Na+ antiporter